MRREPRKNPRAGNLVAVPVARRGRAPQLEALTAVNRLVVARLERNFRLLATLGANRRVKLARPRRVTPPAARGVATATTGGVATTGGIAAATGGVAG